MDDHAIESCIVSIILSVTSEWLAESAREKYQTKASGLRRSSTPIVSHD
jgi:hypothetical protein